MHMSGRAHGGCKAANARAHLRRTHSGKSVSLSVSSATNVSSACFHAAATGKRAASGADICVSMNAHRLFHDLIEAACCAADVSKLANRALPNVLTAPTMNESTKPDTDSAAAPAPLVLALVLALELLLLDDAVASATPRDPAAYEAMHWRIVSTALANVCTRAHIECIHT